MTPLSDLRVPHNAASTEAQNPSSSFFPLSPSPSSESLHSSIARFNFRPIVSPCLMLRYRFALAYQMSKPCPHRHGWLHARRYLQVRQDGLAELVNVGFLLDRRLNLWHVNWVIFKPANTWKYTYRLFNLVAGTTSALFDVRRRGTHTASLLPRGKRLYMRALEDVLWTEISMLLAVTAIHSHRLIASNGPCRT